MGTYKKGYSKRSREQRGFQYLEIKKNQFEREKKKASSMAESISSKNLELKKAFAKINNLEEMVSEMRRALESAHIEIKRLEGVVETQRGIIEDMNNGW